MRAFAIALALSTSGGLAQQLAPSPADPPFAELWHVEGVTTSDDGYGIQLLWLAEAYHLQLPGRRATDWKADVDIRLRSAVVAFCRAPASPGGDHERLTAKLMIGGQWARPSKGAVPTIPVRVSFSEWEWSALLEPERKRPDPLEYLSSVTKWTNGGGRGPMPDPNGPLAASSVGLDPDVVLLAIAAETEAVFTVDGRKTRAELRFEPAPRLARVARRMALGCKGR